MYHDLLADYGTPNLLTAFENGAWAQLKLKRMFLQAGKLFVEVYPDLTLVFTPQHETLTPVITWEAIPPTVVDKRYLYHISVEGHRLTFNVNRPVIAVITDSNTNPISDATWDIEVSTHELRHALSSHILIDGKPFYPPMDVDTFSIWREYHYDKPVTPEEVP